MAYGDMDLTRLFDELSLATGLNLEVLHDRTSRVSGSITAHGESCLAVGPGLRIEASAQLQVSDEQHADSDVWALVFIYVNGQRVAPREECLLTFAYVDVDGKRQWVCRGWENDEYGEWSD
jgi:hypothetical protein